MARKRLKMNPSALLASAARRVELPVLPISIRYDAEADMLYLKLRDDLPANRTTDDMDKGLIFDWHNRTLVGVQMLAVSQQAQQD